MEKEIAKYDERDAQQATQQHTYRKNPGRNEQIETQKTEEERLLMEKQQREKKSTAKAAGLKSTFILNSHELLMTSFGRGNEAIVEKQIDSGTIRDLADPAAFSVTPMDPLSFKIDGRVRNATADNPLYHWDENEQRHDDLIHARSLLERRYYGENYEDNIHIQCIYSILDIEKILVIHINNICYMLNNFLRISGDDFID